MTDYDAMRIARKMTEHPDFLDLLTDVVKAVMEASIVLEEDDMAAVMDNAVAMDSSLSGTVLCFADPDRFRSDLCK